MNAERLFVVGVTHHRAPLEIREKLALSTEAEEALHRDLAAIPGLRELAVLSTCNRVEFYGVADGPEVSRGIEAAYCLKQGFSSEEFERIRIDLRGRDAVEHLLGVASGLDSQLVGETEILGQVKDAYGAAHARKSAGPVLHRVFQKAFQAAKHVRTHTAITLGQVSVANVAVDLALNIFGSLESAKILLLGAGDIGEKTAKALKSRGASSFAVASRRLERAREIAAQFDAAALAFEERLSRLADFDIIVSATSAGHAVISAVDAASAMRIRSSKPLFFIDLSIPRAIEPSAADLQNVFLYNLDDLARIAAENRASREAEIVRCRLILSERADALWKQLQGRINPAAG